VDFWKNAGFMGVMADKYLLSLSPVPTFQKTMPQGIPACGRIGTATEQAVS